MKLSPHIPYNPKLNARARTLRKNLTPAERKFWNALRRMPFYAEFTFNRQKPLGEYIVDFYCHSLGLVVEIDGDSHGESKAIAHDAKRTEWLEANGLTVLRFTNPEVMRNVEGVMIVLTDFIEQQLRKESP